MIQGEPIRAIQGRDDAVVWPIVNDDVLASIEGVTRCVMVCKKDGEDDVTIDSGSQSGFEFDYEVEVRGVLVTAMRWQPGPATQGLFTVGGLWKASVYLYDAVHVDGVFHGDCILLITVVNSSVVVLENLIAANTSAASTSFSFAYSGGQGFLAEDNAVVVVAIALRSSSSGSSGPTVLSYGNRTGTINFSLIPVLSGSGKYFVAYAVIPITTAPDDNLVRVTWSGIGLEGTLAYAAATFSNVSMVDGFFADGQFTATSVASLLPPTNTPTGAYRVALGVHYHATNTDRSYENQNGRDYTDDTSDPTSFYVGAYLTIGALIGTGETDGDEVIDLNNVAVPGSEQFTPGFTFVLEAA